jgi:hypothetical protein
VERGPVERIVPDEMVGLKGVKPTGTSGTIQQEATTQNN